MLFKLNHNRRSHVPRQKHRVTNSAACDAALRQRGSLIVWFNGTKARRSKRELHVGLDAGSGRIVAASLTAKEVDDGAEVGPLLDQATGAVASFTAGGGYDRDCVHAGVAERCPEVAVVVPPRATAVPSDTAETAPTQRSRHLRCIAEQGRMAWQRTSGHTARTRAEAATGRLKRVIGDVLRSRKDDLRATELDLAVHALNCMSELGRPHRLTPDGIGASAPSYGSMQHAPSEAVRWRGARAHGVQPAASLGGTPLRACSWRAAHPSRRAWGR